MNYIPGFSNYLQSSVPEYGAEPIMDTPRQAAVMPMTTEAVAPNYLSGLNLSDADLASLYALSSSGNFNQGNYGSDFGSLDNVYGMNFGSDFGGGLQGGSLFKVNPYLQTLQAPLSDKGNPTAYGGGIEVKSPTQTFRLLDKNTGQVVYEGVGYEGAQEAIDRASALTAKEGAKAQWQIQTPNSQQASGYSTVANEKRSQSTLGDIASVALPVGMALLTGGLSLPAQMAAAGIAGAAGAGLAGKDPLKAGLISAGTAGLMSGSGASDAIGRAVGNVGGTLLGKTAEEVAKQAAAEASGQIVVTGLSKALQGAGSAIGNTLLSQGIKGGLSEVTGFKTPAERFADQPSSIADPVAPYDGLTVTGSKLVSGSGSPFGAAVSIPVNEMLSGALTATQPTQQTKTAEDIEAEKNPMVVTGMETLTPDEILLALGGVGGLAAATAGGGAPTDPAAEKAKADAEAKKKFDLAEALRLAGLAAGVVGNVGKGGGGQTGYYGGTGTGRLNPTFSAKLPAVGGLGNIGAARTKRELGDVDWLTYGTRPELSFFDYARPATPAPVTTPVPGNPAGPIMVTEENPRMAEGGAFSAKRGGRSRRTEFAVNGAGTGRSDDIPAVLSDGEYVIDAETVALLGDGSSKAGAKKLDELRVKVRKHKGQKLAKGRFSANAKRPEAYLSGGRI